MSLADAMAPAQAEYANRVESATWGHLFPKEGDHPGTIVFAVSSYGSETVAVHVDFPGVDSSPWFYEGMMHRITGPHPRRFVRTRHRKPGVYLFRGVCRPRKNGTVAFIGKINLVRVKLT